jgi:RHS repeat-associated protein
MANVDFAGARLEGPANGTATYYRYNEVTGALQAELDSSGTVTAAYVTGPGGSPIAVTRGGKTYFYHTNAHGDVTAITGAGGNPLASFTYDAWGVPTELTAAGQSVPIGTWAGSPGEGLFFLFGGMLYDAATGLYLTKSRVYDPKTGRFLSRDILDESGKNGVYKGFPFGKDAIGTNLYAWCGNSPVDRVDPTGKDYWNPLPDGNYDYIYDAGSCSAQEYSPDFVNMNPQGPTADAINVDPPDPCDVNSPPPFVQSDPIPESNNVDSQAQEEEAQREREAEYEAKKKQAAADLRARMNAAFAADTQMSLKLLKEIESDRYRMGNNHIEAPYERFGGFALREAKIHAGGAKGDGPDWGLIIKNGPAYLRALGSAIMDDPEEDGEVAGLLLLLLM